ncbi:RHS repeat domain-containing protein, partial [Brevibacillus parabrevis]
QKRGGATYGTFSYDKLSRIKEETIQGNTRQYTYDRRGNRQAYANAPADSTRSYELKHDLFNRLTEYKDDKGTTTYTYYPGGLRATKQQTGTVTDTTHYVYLNGQVIEELTQDGRVKARNVFGNQLIWRKDYTTNQEGTYYYNSHGDVVKIKGPSGNVLNTYEYDIWGNLIADKVKETMPNPFAYAGEMYDKESGFYYLRARYYDPKMGRFVSEDTYQGQVDNPLTLNRYTYTHNNPLRFIDPTGHWSTKIAANWTLNEYKNKWANATTNAEREDAEYGAYMLREQMRKAGISEADIMQSSDAMIPEAKVMMIAKIETLQRIENDPLGLRLYTEGYALLVPDFESIPLQTGTLKFNPTKNVTTKWDIKSFSKGELSYNFAGQKVKAYFDGNYWWSKDLTGHGGSAYKVFEKKGNKLYWKYDADEYGNFILDKHKSQTGTVIDLK